MRILFSIICFNIFFLIRGYSQELRTITVNDGLSSMIVRNIAQSDNGLIWIATQCGIQSYNGTFFKQYDVFDMRGVTGNNDNRFLLVQNDKFGRLWAMNRNQLFLYSKELDTFIETFSISDKKNTFIEAMELHVTDSLNLYVVTSNELYHYNIALRKLNSVDKAFGAHSFMPLSNGFSLIATHQGLLFMQLNTDRIVNMISDEKFNNPLLNGLDLRKIKSDGYGNIWLATYTKGIYVIKSDGRVIKPKWDMITHNYRVLDIQSYNNKIVIAIDGFGLVFCDLNLELLYTIKVNDTDLSLSNSGVQSLFADNKNRLWISTFGGGINCIDPHISPFHTIQHFSNNKNSLSNDMVRAIYEDTDGNIWFGTKEGVSIYTPITKQWRHLNSGTDSKFSSNSTMSITEDGNGDIWISTFAGGITVCDKNLHIKRKITTTNSSLTSDDIFVLYTDRDKDIWISGEDGNLSCYNSASQQLILYGINSRIRAITETGSGDILVSGIRGVQKINKKSGKVENVFSPKNQNKHIMVYSVLEDEKGRLWFATDGLGVICQDIDTKETTTFSIDNGLASNVCYCLLMDVLGNIWVSTQMGLTCINGNDFTLQSFSARNVAHGQLREFLYCSRASLKNGKLLFGGFNGCTIFDPPSVNRESVLAPLIFTDFKLFNHSVKPQEKGGLLEQSIDLTSKIELDYTQNTFSIDFAAINFSRIEQNWYSWILEGAEKEWNAYTDRTSAYYTNLSPGSYVFKVRTAPIGGSYNEKAIVIVISSPWWATPIAYLIYTLIILLLIRLIMRFYRNQIVVSQAKEKMDFFVRIAHDIKTPLSLIMLPLSKMKKEVVLNEKLDKELDIAIKNSERLEKLVNQLLQFEKASSRQVKLQVGKYRAEATIESIAKTFAPIVQKKNINFLVTLPDVTTWLWFDMDKFEKILYNLLDNAFKYTPENGEVEIKAKVDADSYIIEIRDSGIGILENQKSIIFRKYYRASNVVNSEIPGSGVGLLIVNELVKLHSGTVTFSSREGEGTTFVLAIPLGRKHFAEQLVDYVEQLETPFPVHANEDQERAKILIVEDNPELLLYIEQNLGEYYNVDSASNGVEAIKCIENNLPDIVITDFMMPEMNGIELCEKIKSTPKWQGVLVIILTALSSNEHKIDGYKAGADGYIEKPFDILVLQSRIENLLKNKSVLRKNILKTFDSDTSLVNNQNQAFVNLVAGIVLEHLSDAEFSIEILCNAVGMSNSTFYRKLKEISNQSPAEFINEVRMNKAAELLKTGKYNVSEVAYMTGFSFPNYFSKVFKKFFGCTPNELLPK